MTNRPAWLPRLETRSAWWPLGWTAALLAVFFTACATKRPSVQAQPPPSEELRARFGTIGVRIAEGSPRFRYQQPKGKGGGAVSGARTGFRSGSVLLEGDVVRKDPYASVVLVPLAVVTSTFGTIGGAMGGTVRGVPAAKRLAAEAVITNALAGLNVPDLLREHLLQVARLKNQNQLVRAERRDAAPRSQFADAESPPARPNTTLELSVVRLELAGREAINPLLKLAFSVKVRLLNVADGTMLYSYTADFTSAAARRFTDWAADDARPLREEIENGCNYVSGRIVEQLFLKTPAPVRPSNPKPPGARAK